MTAQPQPVPGYLPHATARSSRVNAVAKLLWEDGPAKHDWEGRTPDWSEVCVNADFFGHQVDTEMLAAGLLDMEAGPRAALVVLLGLPEPPVSV